MFLIHSFKKISIWILFIVLAGSFSACNNKSYPCPGLGQSSEADMSMFDESGKLKESKKGKGKKSRESGLQNKKNPKKIRAPRKTHI